MKLYLAEGSAGEYDDFHTWAVGVFSTRSKAKAACQSTIKPSKLTWYYNAKTQTSTAFHKAARSWESVDFDIHRIVVDTLYGA